MADSTLEKLFQLINDELKKDVPKYKLVPKEESSLMKALSVILFFNGRFMTGFTTVIYPNIYMPRNQIDPQAWRTIAHEWIHLRRMKKATPFFFGIWYLLPHLLGLLALLSIFAIWFSKLWLLNLLWLLCAAPLPAVGRMWEELEAYTMSLACMYWTNGVVYEAYVDHIAKQFYGANYYFMWPFKNHIKKLLMRRIKRIADGEYDELYPYSFVKNAIDEVRLA